MRPMHASSLMSVAIERGNQKQRIRIFSASYTSIPVPLQGIRWGNFCELQLTIMYHNSKYPQFCVKDCYTPTLPHDVNTYTHAHANVWKPTLTPTTHTITTAIHTHKTTAVIKTPRHIHTSTTHTHTPTTCTDTHTNYTWSRRHLHTLEHSLARTHPSTRTCTLTQMQLRTNPRTFRSNCRLASKLFLEHVQQPDIVICRNRAGSGSLQRTPCSIMTHCLHVRLQLLIYRDDNSSNAKVWLLAVLPVPRSSAVDVLISGVSLRNDFLYSSWGIYRIWIYIVSL